MGYRIVGAETGTCNRYEGGAGGRMGGLKGRLMGGVVLVIVLGSLLS